ncbi:MAG: Fic family protein [Candidatus Micrarchaeota archaeon]
MATIEKQRHGNHDYFYLSKSIRVSSEKVRKIRVFLGRKMPSHDELQTHFKELEKKTPKSYVPKLLSRKTVERLDDLAAASQLFEGIKQDLLPKDFLVRFTYNTNAIEGNPLTLRQTALILSDKIAPQGAKTEDVVEVLNGGDAWDFVKGFKGKLTNGFIRKIQFEVTKNTSCRIQGNFRDSEVRITGSEWKPPLAKEIPGQIEKLVEEYSSTKKIRHPVELASFLHNRLVQIHPFTDGNGRSARLLMNWVLIRNRFPPAIIENAIKEEYYRMIETADKGVEKPFAEFLARQLLEQYAVLDAKTSPITSKD